MKIGDRIRKIREFEGKNQREFASSIKISQPALAMFENGQREPKDIHIEQICTKYEINEHWLRTGDGEMIIPKQDKFSFYLGQIEAGDDEFIKDIIEVYMELDKTSKEALKELLKRMTEKQKSRNQI